MSEKLIVLILLCLHFRAYAEIVDINRQISPTTEILILSNSSKYEANNNSQAEKLNHFTRGGQSPILNEDERKSEIFEQILGSKSNYNKKVRPSGINGSGPVYIYVSIQIRSLDNIDDVKNEYSVQMYFNQEWTDPRLKFSHIENNIEHFYLQDYDEVWTPDLFFVNEKKAMVHDILRPNVYTLIYKDGLVTQNYRITLLASCIFNLQNFPLDVQSCPIYITTFGWTMKDLIIEWDYRNEAITFIKNIEIAKFKLKNFSTENFIETDWSVGKYTSIKLYLMFEREIGFYLIQIYIPCGMLVIVSWVSFWLEPSAMEARVSVGVTTILTIVTQTYGINQNSPPASYVKALDVWTTFCQAMVFAVLLQFSLVNYISHNANQASDSSVESEVMVKDEELTDVRKQENPKAKKMAKNIRKAKNIDLACRVIFPCIFVVFNIIYWATYL